MVIFNTMIALVFHNLIVYLNRPILNHNRAQEQLKTLRHKYFTLPGQLGSGGEVMFCASLFRKRKLGLR